MGPILIHRLYPVTKPFKNNNLLQMPLIYLTVVTCVSVQMHLYAEGGLKGCHRVCDPEVAT